MQSALKIYGIFFYTAKVKVFIPIYEPLEVAKCEKSGKVIAKPIELTRFQK